MNLKTAFSFLLLFTVSHSCKQVYEVDISQPTKDTSRYHVFFINRSLNDNLGVIVTDTNKREINLFYGDKNTQGELVNIQQIVTYLPEHELLLGFELDENLLPKTITTARNDSIITLKFKNYDLQANTVDIDLFDTQNTLIQSRTKVYCEDTILKFKEAKRQFDLRKGLRVAAETGVIIDCNKFLNSLITASNGIGCFFGVVAIGGTSFASLTGIGAALLSYDLLFTANNCNDTFEGLSAIFKGECLPEESWIDQISTTNECGQYFGEAVLTAIRKRKNPVSTLLTLLNKKQGRQCIANLIGDLSEARNEYLNPALPNVPTFPTTPTDIYEGGKSYGDPNIVTFDGKSYGFNGVGEFIATKSSTDNFEIQVRQEELRNRNSSGSVSWNTGLAINTGSDKLCFYPTKYFINQTPYTYSSSIDNTLQNGGSMTGDSKTFVVSTGNGDVIKVFNRGDALDYSIIPNSQRQGKMIGVFGNYDKQTANDLQVRNGALIDGTYSTLYPNFTDSWRIAQNQSLFIYDAGKNTDIYTDRNFPRVPLVISASQRASAEQICKSAGVIAPFLEGCINDVVATGDASLAQRAKNLQEESILRSFDIKFGPNDDKSLLRNTFSASQYGTDYLLCDKAVTYPEINKSISVLNGMETVVYLASETPDPTPSGLSFNLGPYEWNWDLSSTKLPGRYRYSFYDPLYYAYKSFDSNVAIFDGKLHKVVIQSAINLGANTSTYRVYFDDVLVSENVNFTIRRYQHKNVLLANHQRISLSFDSKVKLYRWSFKSY